MRKLRLANPDEPSLFVPAPLPVAPLDDAGRLACLRLIRSTNVGPVTFRKLINQFGGAQNALSALPELASKTNSRRKFRICPAARAEAELEAAKKIGAEPLFTIEPGFPSALAVTDAPPPMLYVKGDVALLNTPCLAIVGSRQASAAGIKLARTIAAGCAEAGLTIVSGLARGIDGAAHSAALPTATIAVVAGGIDQIYPPEHEQLHNKIAEQGCLASEMPPGFIPRSADFPRRNRIIAGLSLGVVIIEAARKSGSLVTARMAGEMGREVFAVPGHPLDPRAQGTLKLLRDGAQLATCADDIVEVLKPIAAAHTTGLAEAAELPEFNAPTVPSPTNADSGNFATNQSSAIDLVLNALGPHPVEMDELARATGLSIRDVRSVVFELDLSGEIEHHGHQLIGLRTTGT